MTLVEIQGSDIDFDEPLACEGCGEPWDRGFFFPEKWGGDGLLYCSACYHEMRPGDFVDAKVKGLDDI